MYRNNVYFNLILVKQANLYKADTCIKRTNYLAPQISALGRITVIQHNKNSELEFSLSFAFANGAP